MSENELERWETKQQEQIEERLAKNRATWVNGSEEHHKQYVQNQNQFPIEFDLCKLDANEYGFFTRTIICSKCGEELMHTKRNYLDKKGAHLSGKLLGTNPYQKMQKQLGPYSHVQRSADGDVPRCYCGFWVKNRLCEDEAGENVCQNVNQYFKCAEKVLELRAREKGFMCKCGVPCPTENIKYLKPSETFSTGVAKTATIQK